MSTGTPTPGIIKCKNFRRTFLDHHYYIQFVWSMLSTRKENFYRNNVLYFHYMTDMATPYHKNPAPGVIKFIILIYTSLINITIYSVGLIYAQEQRRRLLQKSFTFFIWPCPRTRFSYDTRYETPNKQWNT